MVSKKPKTVLYRRKREQKTNYNKRLKLLKSGRNRLVVRFSNKAIYAQMVQFTTKGDKVIISLNSLALKKLGWNYSCKNLPAAYLTGLLLGRKALEKKNKEAILDIGNKIPMQKGRIYAFLQGVIDAGMDVPHGEGIFPDKERLAGRHIQDYAAKAAEKSAQYLKNKAQLEDITKVFEQVKENLLKANFQSSRK